MSKGPPGETTILRDGAWQQVPPLADEHGTAHVSVPVRIFRGDPDNPVHLIARFDYLLGWVDPNSLQPLEGDRDILKWEPLPKDLHAAAVRT